MLIEYCSYDDSTLCRNTEHSEGCYNVICTREHDMTSYSSIRSLVDFIESVPDTVVIALWSGIPCTGGLANAERE